MTARSITEAKREVLRAMRDQRERGVHGDTLRRLGAAQPSALVQELRMRGYEIEELEDLDRGGASLQTRDRRSDYGHAAEEGADAVRWGGVTVRKPAEAE